MLKLKQIGLSDGLGVWDENKRRTKKNPFVYSFKNKINCAPIY
jgi:hypothetical protein